MLNWMERVIRMRKEVPEIGWGEFSVLHSDTPNTLVMRYDWLNNSVVVIHNLSAEPREVTFAVGTRSLNILISLLTAETINVEANGKFRLLLEPYGYRWYRIGGLDNLLKQSSA